MAPDMAITAPVCRAKALTKATASIRVSSVTRSATSASTPLVVPRPLANVLISDTLPRITLKGISSSSRKAVAVRSREAPAPTGSSTTGCPRAAARLPAFSMAGMVRWFNVPMLMLVPAQRVLISSASSTSSAIMGDAPQASRMLAQSLTVT